MVKPEELKVLKQLEELDDRLALVLDWAERETSNMFRYRTLALFQAQYVDDHKKRADIHVGICENYERRISEIEDTVDAFECAYRKCRSSFNNDLLLSYAVRILPSVRKEMMDDIQRRQDEQIRNSKKKFIGMKAADNKRASVDLKVKAHMEVKENASKDCCQEKKGADE